MPWSTSPAILRALRYNVNIFLSECLLSLQVRNMKIGRVIPALPCIFAGRLTGSDLFTVCFSFATPKEEPDDRLTTVLHEPSAQHFEGPPTLGYVERTSQTTRQGPL